MQQPINTRVVAALLLLWFVVAVVTIETGAASLRIVAPIILVVLLCYVFTSTIIYVVKMANAQPDQKVDEPQEPKEV